MVPRTRLWLGLVGVVLAALLALGAFVPLAGSLGDVSDVPVFRVEKQDFVLRVPAQGNLQAVRATPITVPMGVPGPFRIGWLAPDGSRVRAGDVVIRFDPSEIEKRLANAEDDLAETRLKMSKEQIEGSAELRKLERDAEMARVELENARQFQKKDEVIFSRADIIESDIDQELAQEREKHARGARKTRQSLSGTEQGLLAIQMRQADMKIQLARAALTALAVTAPHDGVLVLKRDWRGETPRVGDDVWNGQPLAEIPDLSTMQAEVFVLEADAGGLKPGKPASVVVESDPTVSYGAKISRVDALAKPRLRGSPVQYFAVSLTLDRTDPRVMKPGQRVRASLLLEERKDTFLVPRQAIAETEGRMVVYKQSGGRFEPVEVKLGPSGMGRVVIESGIAVGDVLALRDPTRPADAPVEEAPTNGKGPSSPEPTQGGMIIIR
jgi:multidrug efflux pump subunit AcrA (membrane-fusion protein)